MTWTKFLQFTIPGLVVGYMVSFAFHGVKLAPKTHEESEDNNGDGKPDAFFYLTNGVLVKVAIDRNFDKKPDYYEWYQNGKIHRFEGDENFDGLVDLRGKCKWGLVDSSTVDTDFNGIDDLFLSYTNGILREAVWRPNSRVSPTRIEKYVNGVKIEELSDTNGDGVLERRDLFDSFGNPIGQRPAEQ